MAGAITYAASTSIDEITAGSIPVSRGGSIPVSAKGLATERDFDAVSETFFGRLTTTIDLHIDRLAQAQELLL